MPLKNKHTVKLVAHPAAGEGGGGQLGSNPPVDGVGGGGGREDDILYPPIDFSYPWGMLSVSLNPVSSVGDASLLVDGLFPCYTAHSGHSSSEAVPFDTHFQKNAVRECM